VPIGHLPLLNQLRGVQVFEQQKFAMFDMNLNAHLEVVIIEIGMVKLINR
jgi:hypothetical protein